MTEQKTFKCDRCGKTFYGRADWQIPVLTMEVYYGGASKDDPETNHLCQDCSDSFSEFMREWKQFDKLANQTIKSLPDK